MADNTAKIGVFLCCLKIANNWKVCEQRRMSRHKSHLRILPCRQRNYRFYLDGLYINGKRRRMFFKTRVAAESELERLKILQRQQGQAGLNLSETVRGLAVECTNLLARYPGVTILDATRHYLGVLDALSASVPVEKLCSDYLQAKTRAQLSGLHLNDIAYRLARFERSFAGRGIRSVSSGEIADWLGSLKLAPQSINNYRKVTRALFAYALEHGLVERNPLDAIGKVKLVDAPPAIYSSENLEALLEAAPQDLLPALVLGAFAGLRTAELMRLEWAEVKLARQLVEVTAHKAKTARRRLIPIAPNLGQWLAVCSPQQQGKGKVWPNALHHYHRATAQLCRQTGVKWQDNGLRHSYASYHLAKHQNAPALSLALGHTSPQMLFDHYRELVTPEDAERYWNIFPEGGSK